MNYNEIDGCYGRYITVNPPIPYTLGMEVLGDVDAAGPGAEKWLGRRVIACAKGAYGGYADYVIGDAGMVFDVPSGLDDVAGAAFYFPFHLAWLGLHERGRLQAGETVLVHAGAGGVGSAAIQLAVAAGARVLATAGGAKKIAKCRELGAEIAIDYREQDFASVVLEATRGRGVDLVFDGVGGTVTEASVKCLALHGRIMVIGFAGGIEAEDRPTLTPRALCFGSISLMGVMLAYAGDQRAENPAPGFHMLPRSVGERVQKSLEALLAEGRIRPVVGSVVPFDELPAALDRMDQRLTIGRTVVTLRS
ncbi:MAG TPA: zinc-binding dehydrogenase [Alphaproteobacteria bacterium]|nr:zinc-binding dehydrogenase [Alphaproteobacteria bacterium]